MDVRVLKKRLPSAWLFLLLLIAVGCGHGSGSVTADSESRSTSPGPSESSETDTQPITQATSASTPAATECRPPSPARRLKEGSSLFEVRGRAERTQLWALVFGSLPIRTDREVKIVWRMTGTGPLDLIAEHEDGTRVRPVWGPQEHAGSTWERPGEEWGSGFVFPEAGCWRIRATRESTERSVWFTVQE
jgi:hypothetical protein